MMDQDIIDNWKYAKEASQAKRAENRKNSAELLREEGLTFSTKNDGAHLVVTTKTTTADFWPGTGLWIIRGSNRRGRGVRPLIKTLKENPNA